MNKKKIKRINIRIDLETYLNLEMFYKDNKNDYKSFSHYIRHLLELGLLEKISEKF